MSEICVLGIEAANLLSITLWAFSELEIFLTISHVLCPVVAVNSYVVKNFWMSWSIITYVMRAIFFPWGEGRAGQKAIYTIISLAEILQHLSPDIFHGMQWIFLLPWGSIHILVLSFASSSCVLQTSCLNHLKQGCGLVLLHKGCTIICIHRKQWGVIFLKKNTSSA